MTDVLLYGVDLDARDAQRAARFWFGLLGWPCREAGSRWIVAPAEDRPFRVIVSQTETPKQGQNRIHFDLTSATPEDMRATIARALELGGRRVDIGQSPDETHEVLADPDGNEFCVIEPGNRFLADTGVVGAVNCDGTRAVGQFWSRALGWPLVWDQDEETAIQSPRGGTKVTWSGPPLMPRLGRDRLRLVLAVAAGNELGAAVERLTVLGAKPVDPAPAGSNGGTMTDPDGNEFRIIVPGAPA